SAQRKFLVSALAERIGESVGIAAKEDEFARAAVAKFAEPLGEGVRVEIFSGGVDQDSNGGAIRVEFLEGGIPVANFGNFNWTGAADAFYVVFERRAHLGAAGFAEHEQANSHEGFI